MNGNTSKAKRNNEEMGNVSGRRLQDNKISLLRKGLNFAITLHTVLASVADAICTFLEKIRTQQERNFTEL